HAAVVCFGYQNEFLLKNMDATEILTQNVDKTQLPPLHQKRVLAFVNHFLINSCGFLNDFALQCETKFIELERKLQKVEAALTILEAKLASIPDLEQKDVKEQESTKQNSNNVNNESKVEIDIVEHETEEENVKGIKISEHDAYKKFFKMLQVGVPAQAIKLKMQVEGLDPSMLEKPNIVVPFEGNEKGEPEES
ncbi:hypothetical protein DOY81_007142, partial [Sarcophaga bullata]